MFAAIARFDVRFRWLIVAVWIVGAIPAVRLLPSLSSVTQSNNVQFLPASSPSVLAGKLAAPFQARNSSGTAIIVADRARGSLSGADLSALGRVERAARRIPGVSTVRDLAGTFSVLGLAGGSTEAQELGFSIAFGVVLDTFFVRTLLVPSIAMLVGRWNWWPSRLSRSEPNRTDLEACNGT